MSCCGRSTELDNFIQPSFGFKSSDGIMKNPILPWAIGLIVLMLLIALISIIMVKRNDDKETTTTV